MILKILAWLGVSVVIVIAAAAGLFAYFVYAPAPKVPELSGAWSEASLESGGRQRSYRVYTPRSLKPGSPLVVVLHSSDGNVGEIRAATAYGFERLADRRGFLVAYPRAFEGNWNGCNRAGDYSANTLDIDDVAFLNAMVDTIARESAADRDRVFAVGLSRGGHMALRLALEAPHTFRAVAAIAASLPTEDNSKCATPADGAASVMIMNGTADPLNPFAGGHVRLFGMFDRGIVISSMATAQYFAGLDSASGPTRQTQNFGRDRIEQSVWRSVDGKEVQLSAVQGGGHVVPQTYYRAPRILGRTPREIDGPGEVWAFFARQSPGQAVQP